VPFVAVSVVGTLKIVDCAIARSEKETSVRQSNPASVR